MSAYDVVANAIVSVSEIDREAISPEKHIIDDLGVDSLDMLDITFEIDGELGIKLPLEAWLTEMPVDDRDQALVMSNFVAFVERTCAAVENGE